MTWCLVKQRDNFTLSFAFKVNRNEKEGNGKVAPGFN
jgi:hypothetical protein